MTPTQETKTRLHRRTYSDRAALADAKGTEDIKEGAGVLRCRDHHTPSGDLPADLPSLHRTLGGVQPVPACNTWRPYASIPAMLVCHRFAFLRGSPTVMAHDLAKSPVSGIEAQACGDAHLMNSGAFASPERNLLFDLNDFDETSARSVGVGFVVICSTSCVVAGRFARHFS